MENEKKEIGIDEITAQVTEQLKAEAEVKAKADADAKETRAKIEQEVRAKLEEEAKQELKGAEDKQKAADDLAAQTASKGHAKPKGDVQSLEFYDALLEGRHNQKTTEIEFDMDVNDVEENIKAAKEDVARKGMKADIDGATSYGVEFVPEEYAPGMYFRMGSMHGNLANIGFRKVGMSAETKNIAELLTKPTISAYSSYQDQNLAIENVTATDVTTAQGQLNARIFVAKMNVYNVTLDDEKFGLMKGIKRAMSDELAAALSSAILNGDTTPTHMDEDYEALGANIPEAMWKGLRKLVMAGSLGVDGDSTYTLANMDSVQALMGKYAVGTNLTRAKWIIGVKTYNQLLTLFRASATTPRAADFVLEKGVIRSFMGHEVIVSDKQREDLEIDGYHDESGTAASEGFASLVNVDNFMLGIRNKMKIITVPEPLKARQVVQATLRMDFQPFETPSTTIPTVAGMYGFTV